MRCDLQYSRLACGFLALAVAGTLAIVTFAPLPDAVRAIAWFAVIALATRAHAAIAGVRALRLDAEGAFAVADAHGRWREGRLAEGSFVAPWLTVVHWRPEGGRRDEVVVLLPDMSSAQAMRKIRVLLRWA